MRAAFARLIGEDPTEAYDSNKYTRARAVEEAISAEPACEIEQAKTLSHDFRKVGTLPRVYGSPMPDNQQSDGNPRPPPLNSQEYASLGCWIVPPENYQISGARRQLATDTVHPRVPQQIAASLPCTAPSNTSADYNTDIFLTPFDRAQDMVATGSLINTYTGEVAACFEDALPPPDRIAGDTERERKSSQLRLLAAEGNVPSTTRRKKEQEDPLQAGDAGTIMPAASYRVGIDVQMERAERSERDLYFNRNELAPTELMQTRNPFGFDGYSNRLRIQPYMPTTQELDNKSWTPNATARPSSAAQPRAAQRLSQDAMSGREGPAGCSTHTEPGSLIANVRVEHTNRNLEGQSSTFNPCASQLYGASVESAKASSFSSEVYAANRLSGAAIGDPKVGSSALCASHDSILSTIRGQAADGRIAIRSESRSQAQATVVGESRTPQHDSCTLDGDGRAAARELPGFVPGSHVINEGSRGATAARLVPESNQSQGSRVLSEVAEAHAGRQEQGSAAASLPQLQLSRADARTSAVCPSSRQSGLSEAPQRADALPLASCAATPAHLLSKSTETTAEHIPRNARPWGMSETLVNASRRQNSKPEWLSANRISGGGVSTFLSEPAMPVFGQKKRTKKKHVFLPSNRCSEPQFVEVASAHSAEHAASLPRCSEVRHDATSASSHPQESGFLSHISTRETKDHSTGTEGRFGVSTTAIGDGALASVAVEEETKRRENTSAPASRGTYGATVGCAQVPGVASTSDKAEALVVEEIRTRTSRELAGSATFVSTIDPSHQQISERLSTRTTQEPAGSATLITTIDPSHQQISERLSTADVSEGSTFMDVSKKCTKRALERVRNERSHAGHEDSFAHSSHTGALRARRHRQQASEEHSMHGSAADVARRADSGTLFVRDLRGLEEILPPVVAVVGGDVLMDPMRRFDAGLRTLREEFAVAPQIIYADQRLNERASLGHLHSPHRRELCVVRSPKPVARVRSGLAGAMTGSVTSRCEEIVE